MKKRLRREERRREEGKGEEGKEKLFLSVLEKAGVLYGHNH